MTRSGFAPPTSPDARCEVLALGMDAEALQQIAGVDVTLARDASEFTVNIRRRKFGLVVVGGRPGVSPGPELAAVARFDARSRCRTTPVILVDAQASLAAAPGVNEVIRPDEVAARLPTLVRKLGFQALRNRARLPVRLTGAGVLDSGGVNGHTLDYSATGMLVALPYAIRPGGELDYEFPSRWDEMIPCRGRVRVVRHARECRAAPAAYGMAFIVRGS